MSPSFVVRALTLVCLCMPVSHSVAATPSAAEMFARPTFSDAKLSPDGRSVAAKLNNKNGHDRLAVITLADRTAKVVAEFRDFDIGNFEWVSNSRLVYDTREANIAPGDAHFAPGLFGVNSDGSKPRQLVHVQDQFVVDAKMDERRLPWNTYMLGQPGTKDDNTVWVVRPEWSHNELLWVELMRLDALTGLVSSPVDRPGNTVRWWLDAKGEPRLTVTMKANIETVWYRDPANDKWRALASFDAYVTSPDSFEPLGFAPDGTLYVMAADGDKTALRTFDFAANRVKPSVLVKLEEFDFSGALITNRERLLGVRYLGDGLMTAWFDAKMKAYQAAVDALLPGTINMLSMPSRSETPWLLVESFSDRQPRVLMLYNVETKQLSALGKTMPQLKADDMGTLDIVRYPARDGLNIPAWLTLPADGKGKKLPLVVMVHGGPYARGVDWRWHADAQFLASRGYAVLEPEFRGSTGYGWKLFKAGWKQWGLAMQNDIADGAKWAIAQGYADPKRICIMGASYGGYATLMGLIRDPELFKCGIDYLGVTDINLLYDGTWRGDSNLDATWKRYGMPTLVGDQVKDAEQLARTSPLLQAAKVTQPLLLAYGGADKRVPVYHGQKFYDAVRATNKNVEWVVYPEEGHGWTLHATRVDFWTRVEKFLKQHIGE